MRDALKDDEQDTTPEGTEAPSRPPLEGRELMTWTVKAMPQITPRINAAFGSVGLIPLSMILYGYFGADLAGKHNFCLDAGIVWFCMWLYFWRVGFRQKTVYHYRITEQGAEMEYYLHYPKYFRTFFKMFASVLLIVVLGLIAVDPSFIWMLAGPGGMAIMASRSLVNIENEKTYIQTIPLEQYNFVTVDRKRKIIVTHKTDPDIGFEYYLPKELFDACLSTLKTVLPQHVTYNEKSWKW